MEKYLVQGTTMANIAAAIRDKAGISASMMPGAMPGYIRSIQTGTLDTTGVPDDIAAEAERVASSILNKKGSNALTFIAIADMHEMGDGDHSDTAILERYRRANRNAGQAAKLISDRLALDFFACLGDFAWEASTTTAAGCVQSIVAARNDLFDVVSANESFLTPGNHDTLTYSYSQNGEYLSAGVMEGLIGTYRYKDFTTQKVRVICLNTAEVEGMTVTSSQSTERMTGAQLQWFAQSLDLSDKSDAAEWGIIILSHHPLDWGNIKPAANCLAAYLNGDAYAATHNGVAVSYDFSGKNAAPVIANFHGHTHCFNVSDISGTTIKRIAIPNACYARTNEYGEEGNSTFGDTDSYEKDDDGADGDNTAFCVVSVDLDQKVIYADCFGAGYDRTISYGEKEVVTYAITNHLVNASTSNGAVTVLEGSGYSAVITADDGYEIDSVAVTMDGEDITASAYSEGSIYIEAVTGDIVITVTTVGSVVYDVTNLVLTSEAQDSTDVYNGVGYKNGTYASESGDGTDASCVATGWISYTWSPENVIYVRGAAVTAADHVRFFGYRGKSTLDTGAYGTGSNLSTYFTVEELEEGTYYKLTPLAEKPDVTYIRISLIGTGKNLIITVNEPITVDNSESGGDAEDTGGTGTYTNLVPTAVATDGTTVFNGTGYMDGTYASVPHYGTDEACVTTGFIWLDSGVSAIYVKGAAWDTSNGHCRIHVYAEGNLGTTSASQELTAANLKSLFTVETLDTNYYKFTVSSANVRDRWYCMSLVGTGESLIITHDEPIE